ncbi:CRISPR-associated helicase Cas3' [Clostridium perfringens]|uniref:CRISPR-associated helicase Cas3' n=1 Tax=Clostridium perfringens TaxID=1502 RepID=UPI0024BD1AF1|nr:CRISPR-associated helicase Cas3' [Clostridium perfringens]
MDYYILKNYKAKLDGTTIYQHSLNLVDILSQLNDIHEIDDINTLNKCAMLHDIGKCVKEFQDNIESTHRKVRHELLSASYLNLSFKERLIILLHHKKIDYWKSVIGNECYVEELEEIKSELNCDFENINNFLKSLYRRNIEQSLKDKELILMLGYLKLADHISSAGIKKIDEGLYCKDIYKFSSFKSVQEQVLELKNKEDIIVIAPTGSGKTETSMLWADKMQNKNRSKRIFYLLPYTASINALYKRFKKEEISVGVLHSKVRSLLIREDDILDEKEELELFKKNIKQVTIATIFQIVRASFGAKNWEMQLAQFKNSIFIVDEIHCFKIRELAFLLETLRWLKREFNISICIMSASIPKCLQDLIKERLEINNIIRATNKDFKLRHRIHYEDNDVFQKIDYIKEELNKNKKVLICVNRVDASQKIYSDLKSFFKDNKKIKLIHGKFNARDRSIIENDIDNCDVLIGTQAIEVSLDIDYDILFTEIAPLDSLLQRFGRVNRKGNKGISNIYILKESDRTFYDEDIINNTYEQIIKIIEDDKGLIFEEKVNSYLNEVYKNIDMEEYNRYRGDIEFFIRNLKVGSINKDVTEEIINNNKNNNNNNISMLPISLLNKYLKLKEEMKFVEMNELFVNANRQFAEYNEENNIYITHCKYDYRGLVTDERE